jgi:lysophospholipase L1-like esterase
VRILQIALAAVLIAACGSQSPPAPSATPVLSAPPSPYRIVALGDSLAFGANCPCPPFPARFSDVTADRLGVETDLSNFAVSGITSEMLLTMVRTGDRDAILRLVGQDPVAGAPRDIRPDLAAADMVLLEIGANDFLQRCAGSFDPCAVTAPGVAANVAAILDEVAALQGSHPYLVRMIGYYDFCQTGDAGPHPSEAQQCTDFLRALNAANSSVATQRSIAFVDLIEPFNGPGGTRDAGDLLSNDHVHPSDSGHQLIADLLVGLGWGVALP